MMDLKVGDRIRVTRDAMWVDTKARYLLKGTTGRVTEVNHGTFDWVTDDGRDVRSCSMRSKCYTLHADDFVALLTSVLG